MRFFHAQMLTDTKPRTSAGSSQGHTWTGFLKKILAAVTSRLRK